MFDFLRVVYLTFIALFGYFLFMFLVYGIAIPSAVSCFALALAVLSNTIKFAISWDVERETQQSAL